MYPLTRPRRLRSHPWLRDLVEDVHLSVKDLVYPVFVREDHLDKQIPFLPHNDRHTLKELPALIRELVDLGIPSIALFPMIDQNKKDEQGSEATNPQGLIPLAIQEIRNTTDKIGIITDVALDPYTSHGQDGIIHAGEIHNDETIERLCAQALTLAKAGAHIIAPSDMMDGRIGCIRQTLEDHHFPNVSILAYAAKYASSLYGPFRHAVGSINCLGKADKKTYQMSYGRTNEACWEAELDVNEGADMLMVKPATLYMDVIYKLSQQFPLPVFAYHVSGEYSALALAAQQGVFSFNDVLLETLISLKRSGAQAIFTYGAKHMAEILKK